MRNRKTGGWKDGKPGRAAGEGLEEGQADGVAEALAGLVVKLPESGCGSLNTCLYGTCS